MLMLRAKFSNVKRETIIFLGTRDPWSCSSVKCECKALRPHQTSLAGLQRDEFVKTATDILSSPPVPSLFAINTSTLLMARLRKTVVIVETSLSRDSVSGELKHCAGFHWSDSNKSLEFWECFRSVIGVLTKYSIAPRIWGADHCRPELGDVCGVIRRGWRRSRHSLSEYGHLQTLRRNNLAAGSAVLLSDIPH